MALNRQRWMAFLLAAHVLLPTPHYPPAYPDLVLVWFAFEWSQGKWVLFVPYMFMGLPAFLLIGLPTIIPFLLFGLLVLQPKPHSSKADLLSFALAAVLSAVYLYGWFDYTWPNPYQPVQTATILLFTLVSSASMHPKKQTKGWLKRPVP